MQGGNRSLQVMRRECCERNRISSAPVTQQADDLGSDGRKWTKSSDVLAYLIQCNGEVIAVGYREDQIIKMATPTERGCNNMRVQVERGIAHVPLPAIRNESMLPLWVISLALTQRERQLLPSGLSIEQPFLIRCPPPSPDLFTFPAYSGPMGLFSGIFLIVCLSEIHWRRLSWVNHE